MDVPDHSGVHADLVADDPNWLLQLPETALDLVLQKMDPSLASTAASCRNFSLMVLVNLSKAVVQYGDPDTDPDTDTLASFQLWVERHNPTLTNLSECHVSYPLDTNGACDYDMYHTYNAHMHGVQPRLSPVLCHLPRPQLRQLVVRGMKVQLAPSGDCPGLLHGCTGLTALAMQECHVQDDSSAASAAVAACTGLQCLSRMMVDGPHWRMPVVEQLQFPKLTTLWLYFTHDQAKASGHVQLLKQLSALENLQSLVVGNIKELPDGVPTQLTKLTTLSVQYYRECTLPDQFKHLSSLTALQEVRVKGYQQDLSTELSGIGHLAHLTSLSLGSYNGTFSTTSIQGWASTTALQILHLSDSPVQPEALAGFTRLRDLSLAGGATLGQLLEAVSCLSHLTQLRVYQGDSATAELPPTAFTALTASTNLCSLKLGWCKVGQGQKCALFRSSYVYPHLRVIDLARGQALSPITLLGEQELQHMCSSCPALESLKFVMFHTTSATACLPLLQLSALTRLHVRQVHHHPRAPPSLQWPAVLDAAAQLTGLKDLRLYDLHDHQDPALRQLAALTSLKTLVLAKYSLFGPIHFTCKNRARFGNPPDVWAQLLRHLELLPPGLAA